MLTHDVPRTIAAAVTERRAMCRSCGLWKCVRASGQINSDVMRMLTTLRPVSDGGARKKRKALTHRKRRG